MSYLLLGRLEPLEEGLGKSPIGPDEGDGWEANRVVMPAPIVGVRGKHYLTNIPKDMPLLSIGEGNKPKLSHDDAPLR